MPRDLLTSHDIVIIRRSYRASRAWERTLQRAMLALSDQQMVAGIAVLIAGFAGWTTMSVYHWQVVTYLGWLSSNVHLTTLSFLRDYLRHNTLLRRFRLVGMALLVILLIVALVPTISNFWTATLYAKTSGIIPSCWTAQLPVWCTTGSEAQALGLAVFEAGDSYLIDGPGLGDVNPDAVVSYIILVGGFLWKAGNLAETTQGFLQKWLWRFPMAILERPLRSLARRKQVNTVSLDSSENAWNFGQILPLLLLALPLLAVVEALYEKDNHRTSSEDYQMRTAITNDSYTGLLDSTSHQSTALAESSQPDSHLSKLFAQLRFETPDSATELRHSLYSSKMFKAVLLLWQFFLMLAFGYVVGMKVVFANQPYDVQLEAALGGMFLWIGLISTWSVTMLSVRWSKLYE
ncbi:hypothetical protein LTS14_006140 [Recurvomyces mirabilis]|nr:hypothetical protein LTS14_006140 [Recurvomyces mirabilis]